ncbi:hypothetical protein ACIA8E_37980 [Streptomyces sp. NPDC051664]|uniref:hypothetical protein n=1 Tax=Streptomyces sp. NPDC051664 TaxID=3365668 RepID=UPI0037922A54
MRLLDGARAAWQSFGGSAGRWRTVPAVLSIGLSTAVLAGCGPAHSDSQPRSLTPTPASAQQMVYLLESLLPQGKYSAQHGQGQGGRPGSPPSAELILEVGGKAAKVTVALNRYPLPVPAQLAQCPDTAYHPYSQCAQSQLPGGARLVRDQSPRDEDKPSGGKVRSVLLTHKDGTQVFVSETGGLDGKTAAGNTALPLSLEQLSAIATDTAWKPLLSAMPAPRTGGPRTGSVSEMTGAQITHVIKELLPAGLHAAQEGGSQGFGHVVVDDGHGKSLVAVNVQRWKPDDANMTKLFEKADTQSDGTRVTVRKSPPSQGGKGAVEWSVDTFRKDGLRVVISAVNAGAYKLPASRTEPALKIGQLQQIALAPTWRRAGS